MFRPTIYLPFHKHIFCMLPQWRLPAAPPPRNLSEHQGQPYQWSYHLPPWPGPQVQLVGHRTVRWDPPATQWSWERRNMSSTGQHISCHCVHCTWNMELLYLSNIWHHANTLLLIYWPGIVDTDMTVALGCSLTWAWWHVEGSVGWTVTPGPGTHHASVLWYTIICCHTLLSLKLL